MFEYFRTERFEQFWSQELFEHFRTEMFEQLKHYVLNVVIFIIFNFRNKKTKNVRRKLDICGPCNSLPPSVGNEF